MATTVTPEVHAAVMARDLQCFLFRLDREHRCYDRWGTSHSPYDVSMLTLDHVKDEPAMGKRAPSDSLHMVAMCWQGNVRGPSKAVRQAERAYLASFRACPDCGYHGGQHGENCHLTEAELREAWR